MLILGLIILGNLKIYANLNGWGAYDAINLKNLKKRLGVFNLMRSELTPDLLKLTRMMADMHQNAPYLYLVDTREILEKYPFIKGQEAHYKSLSEEEYKTIIASII